MRDDAVLRRALPLGRGLGRPLKGKKRRVLRNSRPCCQNTVVVYFRQRQRVMGGILLAWQHLR